ncbi:hypothetical protein ACFE04_008657 [Oxalis oulophora]
MVILLSNGGHECHGNQGVYFAHGCHGEKPEHNIEEAKQNNKSGPRTTFNSPPLVEPASYSKFSPRHLPPLQDWEAVSLQLFGPRKSKLSFQLLTFQMNILAFGFRVYR